MKTSSSKMCCVPICKALMLKDNKLVPFPKGKKQAKRWAEALGIDEEQTKKAYVCVLHFRQRDFIESKDSNAQKNKLQLDKTALPSRNLLNFTAAASKLKSCYVILTQLPTHRLKKIEPPKKVKNKLLSFIINKTLKINNKNVKPKSIQLNNKIIEKLINTPEKIITYKKLAKDNKIKGNINILNSFKTTGITSTLNENSTQLESLNVNKNKLKSILKNSSIETSNSKHIKKKVRIKTKLGQFMPKIRKKVVVRDQIKTNKEIINYEVVEQKNDCNVLILRI